MNSSIFGKIYKGVTTACEYAVIIPLFAFFLVQAGLYFRDASYQAIVLNQDWESSIRAQCRAIPGCLAVKFTSDHTHPAKLANRLARIGTHVTAHVDVASGAQELVLDKLRLQLTGAMAMHVNLEVSRIGPTSRKG